MLFEGRADADLLAGRIAVEGDQPFGQLGVVEPLRGEQGAQDGLAVVRLAELLEVLAAAGEGGGEVVDEGEAVELGEEGVGLVCFLAVERREQAFEHAARRPRGGDELGHPAGCGGLRPAGKHRFLAFGVELPDAVARAGWPQHPGGRRWVAQQLQLAAGLVEGEAVVGELPAVLVGEGGCGGVGHGRGHVGRSCRMSARRGAAASLGESRGLPPADSGQAGQAMPICGSSQAMASSSSRS